MNLYHLREMITLAIYEEGEGRQDKEMLSYYRSDYVALKMIGTALATTVGYVFVLGLIAAGNAEVLLEAIGSGNITGIITTVAVTYGILMALYLAGTFITARRRIRKAEKRRENYKRHLSALKKLS